MAILAGNSSGHAAESDGNHYSPIVESSAQEEYVGLETKAAIIAFLGIVALSIKAIFTPREEVYDFAKRRGVSMRTNREIRKRIKAEKRRAAKKIRGVRGL